VGRDFRVLRPPRGDFTRPPDAMVTVYHNPAHPPDVMIAGVAGAVEAGVLAGERDVAGAVRGPVELSRERGSEEEAGGGAAVVAVAAGIGRNKPVLAVNGRIKPRRGELFGISE
jgi:hypothetical protein